jgi:D-alanyl-D-alanine dipeptidase
MKKIFLNSFASVSILFTLLLMSSCNTPHNEESLKKNPYDLEITSTIEQYHSSVKEDSSMLLVNLEEYIPGIILDIRYATTNNFTGEQIYTSPEAWLRKEAADSLKKVQEELNKEGLGIKVFDAYRPYEATLYFYEVYEDTTFVAAPWKGSIHNRGGAVDLTLINIETGEELEMPTPFDEFSERASHHYTELPQNVLDNRQKLLKVMKDHGFTMYEYEWWHYNIKGRDKYGLLDISFEELGALSE